MDFDRLAAEKFELKQISTIYGSALPMQMIMERNFSAEFQGAPGLPSSNFGLEILMGDDCDIPMVVNRPEPSFVEKFKRDF